MFVCIRSAAFVIVVTQKLVLQQSKNVTANTIAPSFYSISPWSGVILSPKYVNSPTTIYRERALSVYKYLVWGLN